MIKPSRFRPSPTVQVQPPLTTGASIGTGETWRCSMLFRSYGWLLSVRTPDP
jgi:hypothetical protein